MAMAAAAATAVSLDARPAPLDHLAPSITILTRSTGVEVLRLEGRRAALERCAAGALGEDPGAARSIGYELRIEPNGDVGHVELAPRGPLSRDARACLVRALAGAIFNPPEGGGRLLRGEILVGAPAPSAPGAPAIAHDPDGVVGASLTDVAPLALHAHAPPPEGRAVDAAVRAASTCATSARGRMRVRLLATDGGALRRVTVDGDLPASALACARALLAGTPARASAPERAVAVDVELVIEGKQVRVAR
jgi:hypothetical protein